MMKGFSSGPDSYCCAERTSDSDVKAKADSKCNWPTYRSDITNDRMHTFHGQWMGPGVYGSQPSPTSLMTSASDESPMTSVETGPTDFVYLALLCNFSGFSLVMLCQGQKAWCAHQEHGPYSEFPGLVDI